ncbi:MAG: DUF3365 domain-containing protein [Deltaproteobacteria bacterium]|nr:DUF3365 domain-containing protein [Deltaproteobacteria bacterium]
MSKSKKMAMSISIAALFWFSLSALALSQGGEMGGGPPLPEKEALKKSREISADFSNELQNSFSSFMTEENYLIAIEGYSNTAQQITQAFRDQTGYYLKRVSLRYRNPANAPDPYEKSALTRFETLNKAGKITGRYDSYEVTVEKGRKYLRYMKPLTTDKACLKCHGGKNDIPEEVKGFLKANYPQDAAMDFRVGSVRGAVSIKIPLTAEKGKPLKK